MRNRLLNIIHNVIPYVKELRPYAGSIAACVLMQQLDHWFADYPDGYFKFLEPCELPGYKDGDSWTEELGVSPDEFRTAFDKIGTRHASKTAYMEAADKFKGKFYCSYHDKKEGKTWYFRNHELVDAVLDEIQCNTRPVTVAGKRQLQEPANASYRDGEVHLQEPANASSRTNSTKKTAKTTAKTTTDTVDAESKISLTEPERATLYQFLIEMRLDADTANYLLAAHPENCRKAPAWWATVDRAKIRSTQKAVRSFIEHPEKWPANGSTPEPDRPKLDTAKVEELAQRISRKVYESLPASERRGIDSDVAAGADFDALMEKRHKTRTSAIQQLSRRK